MSWRVAARERQLGNKNWHALFKHHTLEKVHHKSNKALVLLALPNQQMSLRVSRVEKEGMG